MPGEEKKRQSFITLNKGIKKKFLKDNQKLPWMQHSEFRQSSSGQKEEIKKRVFKAKIDDTGESYDVILTTFENPEKQDLIEWLREFERIRLKCSWSEAVALKIMKRFISKILEKSLIECDEYMKATEIIRELATPKRRLIIILTK